MVVRYDITLEKNLIDRLEGYCHQKKKSGKRRISSSAVIRGALRYFFKNKKTVEKEIKELR